MIVCLQECNFFIGEELLWKCPRVTVNRLTLSPRPADVHHMNGSSCIIVVVNEARTLFESARHVPQHKPGFFLSTALITILQISFSWNTESRITSLAAGSRYSTISHSLAWNWPGNHWGDSGQFDRGFQWGAKATERCCRLWLPGRASLSRNGQLMLCTNHKLILSLIYHCLKQRMRLGALSTWRVEWPDDELLGT